MVDNLLIYEFDYNLITTYVDQALAIGSSLCL